MSDQRIKGWLVRKRWWLALVALVAAGLIPVYAFRTLNAAGSYAVLADTVNVNGGAGTMTTVAAGGTGAGAGIVGANNVNIGMDATRTFAGEDNSAAINTALDAADDAADAFVTEASTTGTDPGADLSGATAPGVYYHNGPATLPAGDLTLTTPGDYLIVVDGDLTVAAGTDLFAGGAAPANVYLIVTGNVVVSGSRIDAEVVAAGSITTVDGTVVNGKLISTGSAINFVDDTLVTDAGQAPVITTSLGAASTATIDVCVGDEVTYTVSATDPDPTGDTTLAVTPAVGTYTPAALPQTAGNVNTTFTWTPAMAGTTVLTYTATDETGALDTLTVTINVSAPPQIHFVGVFSGQRGGTGTLGDPFLLCPNDSLTYSVAASDPDSDQVTVSVATDLAAPTNLEHTPTLPVGPTVSANIEATFSPDEDQEGVLAHITYTATDDSAAECASTLDLYVQVTNLPVFTAPTAEAYNVCVGDTLQYDIRGSDADDAELLALSVQNTPTGAFHASDFGGDDSTGAGGGNFLALGNPVESRFQWTPTIADVGDYLLTYTIVDDLGCLEELAVTINVTQRPTIAVTSNGNPVAVGETLTVCAGESLDFSVAGTDPDSDTVTLTGTGLPANLTPSTNPLAIGTPTATVDETFSPVLAQGSQTFTFTYTATDGFSCDATRVVTIYVSSPPVFNQPVSTTINACVGDALRIPVRASDADAGDVVTLTSGVLPGGATLDPTLPANGNPVSTDIVWTPAAAGTSIVNFTATDTNECTATQTVTINVSNRPTISVINLNGGQGGTGTAADPVRLCVNDTLHYTVDAGSGDVGEAVTVTATGVPTGMTHAPALPASDTPNVTPLAEFAPTASQGGQTFTITYTAADGVGGSCTATTTLVIKVSNAPVFDLPTATTINVCVGSPVTFPVRASDADTGDVVTLTSTALPGGATLTPPLPVNGNPASSTFNWTPAAAGNPTVTFTATDASGCATTQVVTINVSAVPVLTITPGVGATSGAGTAADPYVVCPAGTSAADTLTYSVSAVDSDVAQTVRLEQTGAPAGTHTLALPQTGAQGAAVSSSFSLTPTVGQAGQTFTINYTATDNSGATCAATGTVVIQVGHLPQITADPSTINLCVGQTATLRVRATDEDAGLVTLTQSNAPASLVFVPGLPLGANPVETVATFTPTNADAGTRVVTFTATDADGCAQTTTVTLNVSQLPTVAVTGVTGASAGTGTAADPYVVCPAGTGAADTLALTVTGADPDATQTVTLSQSGSPGSATYSPTLPATGAAGAPIATAFSYTAAAGDAGQTFTVTYTATDSFTAGCSATTTVVLRVANLPVFDGDTPAANAVFNACVGEPVSFRVHASDADGGDQVTLSHTGGLNPFFTPSLPTTGNPVETVFNWTPGAGAPASTTLVFTATDSTGCAVTRSITINVSRIPTVAVSGASGAIRGTGTAADPYVVCPPGTAAADTLTYTVTGADADADQTVTLSETGSPSGATYTPTLPATGAQGAAVATGFSYTPVAGDAGQTFTVTYTATDSFDPACSATTTVTIRVSNLPQITADPSTINLCVGETATLRVRATDADGGLVNLTQSNAPASLVFVPGLPLGANPVETVATFTPTNADAGTRVVTFTATDADGCAQTTTVTLNVSRVPTVAVTGAAGASHGTGTAADPYVVCPPGTSAADTLTYSVTGADADTAQTVTLSQSGSPTGATYTPTLPNTGAAGAAVTTAFSFTPTAGQSGQTFTVTYTATDNFTPACTATTTVVIRVSNLPQITASRGTVNLCVGQSAPVRIRATDADGGIVTLSQSNAPASLDFVPGLPLGGNPVETVATFTPTDADAGSRTVTFTATDTDGCTATTTVTLNVSRMPSVAVGSVTGAISGAGTAANPYVVCPAGTSPADTLAYSVTASDPDTAQTVTLSQSGAPAGSTHSPTLPATGAAGAAVSTAFAFTPAANQAGQTFTVTYTATDSFNPACSATTTVVIRVDQLPAFGGSTPADGTVLNTCIGQPVTFRVRATDADNGDQVTLTHTGGLDAFFTPGLPAVGNPVEATFNWTPAVGAASTNTLVFTATDSAGCSVSRTIIISVSQNPTVTVGSVTGAMSGTGTAADPYVVCPPGTAAASTLAYTVSGSDPDATDAVTLTQSGSPAGGVYNPTLPRTGAVGGSTSTAFSFTPVAGDAGQTYTITYTVTDSSAAACTSSTTVVIRVDSLPQFTAPNQTTYNVCTGTALQFTVRATDADNGDTVTLTGAGLPAGATLTPTLSTAGNPVEAQFNWTPSTAGTFTVVFTATDRAGCAQTRNITIRVSTVPVVSVGSITGAEHGTGSQADPLVVCVTPAVPLSFTVTAADADAPDTLTLTQTGAPSGATFNVTGTNPAIGTFSFSPTTQQGGQTYAVTFSVGDSSPAGCGTSQTVYIRVSSLPVVTATASNIVLCEGQPIAFRVKASDTDPGNVTIGTPTLVASEGAPALNLVYTQSLPASGNPVETAVSGTAPHVTADATYTLTYPVTDADGCRVTQVVTIVVRTTPPSSVQLSRNSDGAPFGEEICYTAVVLDNCPESEGGPRRVPGVQVVFSVTGETGNNGTFLATTNANGEATYCLTPRFPGALTVTVGIDANGDGVVDGGLSTATDTITIPAPEQVGTSCFISGHGRVDVNDPAFGNLPVVGQFNLDISPRKNGKFKGTMAFTVVGGGTTRGKRTNIQIRSTRIDYMACTSGDTGRVGLIFGQASVKGMSGQGLNGTVPFRVDALDAGSPGAPGDRFVLTFLNTGTNLPVGPIGGNLIIEGRRLPKDDVRIRVGAPVP